MARKKKTEEQMEMFEVGGLKDEGGTVDPVSGNDVPPGSTQAEVRDDIPAQLSEGEFVLPADVVRYIGLENLMQLRAKAKEGLAKMEAMGQMGNAEEATMDDDIEYNAEIDSLIDNFDPEDPSTLEFAEGGVVYAQQGAFMPGQAQPQQFSYGYMPPQQQVGYQAPQVPTTQLPDYSKFVSQPAQAAVGQQRGIVENRQYIGPNGELITILFIDGKPQQEIPANFKVYKPEEEKPQVAAPTVQKTDTGGGDGPEETKSTEPTFGFGSYRSMEEMTDIFSTVNKDLQNLKATQATRKQTPFMAVELFNKVVTGLKEGYYTNEAVKQVRNGENLTNKPEGEYGQWRQDMSKFMAAATLETENEAKAVSSGDRDLEGSSFASRDEADAVANSGWGSDDHFDAIEASFSSNTSSSGSGYDPGTGGGDGPGSDSDSGSGGNTNDGGAGVDSGTPFSKGGAVQQTKRALKSSRKK
jgi:hypothetical protein